MSSTSLKEEKFNVNNRSDAAICRPIYDARLLAFMTKNDIPNVLNRTLVDSHCPSIPYPWPQPPAEPIDANGNIVIALANKWTIADKIYRKRLEKLVDWEEKHAVYDLHFRKLIQFVPLNFPLGSTAHNMYNENKSTRQRTEERAFTALTATPGVDVGAIIRDYQVGLAPAPALVPLFVDWQTASIANSAKAIWQSWEDWWLQYSLPQSNSWKPHWDQLCQLRDLDMDVSEFVAEWFRLRYLVETSSNGAITDDMIAFQLCEAIQNPKLQDDLKDYRLDLDKPVAARKWTEHTIFARFQAVITAFPAFDHPSSKDIPSTAPTPRSFYGNGRVVKKDEKGKSKTKKAARSAKPSANESSSLPTTRTSPSASKKKSSTSSRAVSRTSTDTSTPLERTVNPDGPYPSRLAALPPATGSNICQRCGRRGHYAFKCKESCCSTCGVDFPNWKFFHKATECK